jgi:hypothetical protein
MPFEGLVEALGPKRVLKIFNFIGPIAHRYNRSRYAGIFMNPISIEACSSEWDSIHLLELGQEQSDARAPLQLSRGNQ